MRASRTFLPTLREVPSDAVVDSHRLMLRAAMLRKLSNGLFVYLPIGLRVLRKIEAIIRQEMDSIGALEIKPPVVVPGEFWKESGRWDSYGDGMLRVKNRLGGDFVVSPTAEEAFTALMRGELSSYRQLPLTLYQINTKYRDEVRPRYGVMRGREFTMKDAYSYHSSDESLDETYRAMGAAYRRVFRRCGLTVIPVRADTGAMGGTGSEEYMVESSIGDNTLIICRSCDYAANVEKATCKPDFSASDMAATDEKIPAEGQPITTIETPDVRTIAELCSFLNIEAKRFIKTLIYRALNVDLDLSAAPGCAALERRSAIPGAPRTYPEVFFAVAIRGDLDVNEAKLAASLSASEVSLASEADVERLSGAPVGFVGPVGLSLLPVVADESVTVLHDAVSGARAKDLHYAHVSCGRDFIPWMVADLRSVKAGDRCSLCGGELYEKKGNELGHIFKLGYKYTAPMGVSYLDENGKPQVPSMGCYGIGLDRTLASVIEERHDENGILWPMSIAPFHVSIVPIKYAGAVKVAADTLHDALESMGLDVFLDDRNERPGVKFADTDLIGIPLRIVIAEKNLPNAELKRRGEPDLSLIDLSSAADELSSIVRTELVGLRHE